MEHIKSKRLKSKYEQDLTRSKARTEEARKNYEAMKITLFIALGLTVFHVLYRLQQLINS